MNMVLLCRKVSNRLTAMRPFMSRTAMMLGFNRGYLKAGRFNHINLRGAFLYKTSIIINGQNNRIIVEEGTYLHGSTFHIEGDGNTIRIKKNCTFGETEFWIEDGDGEICIGNCVKSFGCGQIACIEGRKILIGDDCLFAKGAQIRTGDSHSVIDLHTGERINTSEDVYINNHVWLGASVTVLKGVTIGNDSVIGTGSIVTKDIPANSVAVGCPAKMIKGEITWDIQRA